MVDCVVDWRCAIQRIGHQPRHIACALVIGDFGFNGGRLEFLLQQGHDLGEGGLIQIQQMAMQLWVFGAKGSSQPPEWGLSNRPTFLRHGLAVLCDDPEFCLPLGLAERLDKLEQRNRCLLCCVRYGQSGGGLHAPQINNFVTRTHVVQQVRELGLLPWIHRCPPVPVLFNQTVLVATGYTNQRLTSHWRSIEGRRGVGKNQPGCLVGF